MAPKALPSPEVLRQLLRYDPETGKLFWRERGPEWFTSSGRTWNSRYAGTEALAWVMVNGYKQGAVLNRNMMAHRVIWALQTGAWPVADIDHINGDRADNRWCNLREATRTQNNQNRRSIAGRSSKYLGVSRVKSSGKWDVRIVVDGKQKCLGHYDDEMEAAMVYDEAARTYHGAFARPNFSSGRLR